MNNHSGVKKSESSIMRIGTSGLMIAIVVYCGLGLSACSDSRDVKQKDAAAVSSPSPVAKPETPATQPAEPDKPGALAKPDDTAPVAKAKETSTAETAKIKEAVSPPAKPVEPATSAATKAKDTAPAADAKTKESAPALAAKPPETAPSPPKKEEVATVKEPTAAPLSLKMNIIGQRKEPDGSYTEVLVSEGSVMRSRDNFQIHFQVNRPAHVYILMYDSEGKAGQIYPDPKASQSAAVQAGKKLVLPSNDLWFWLDDNAGTETIYVLASETAMTDIGGLMAKMEGSNDAGQKLTSRQIKEKITIMQRGVGGITKGDAVTYTLSDGKKIQKVTDVVTGTGSVVRAVSFQHR